MKITPLIVFCLCTVSLTAQTDKAERLTQFIEQTLAATDHLTGLSVAITNPEGTLYAKGFGYGDRAQQ